VHASQTHTRSYLDSVLTRLIDSIDSVIEVNLPSAIQCIGIVSSNLCNSSSNSSSYSNDGIVSIENAVLFVCKVLYQAKNRSQKLVHMVSDHLINTAFVNHHAITRAIARTILTDGTIMQRMRYECVCLHISAQTIDYT
jgi:hypothetical protein